MLVFCVIITIIINIIIINIINITIIVVARVIGIISFSALIQEDDFGACNKRNNTKSKNNKSDGNDTILQEQSTAFDIETYHIKTGIRSTLSKCRPVAAFDICRPPSGPFGSMVAVWFFDMQLDSHFSAISCAFGRVGVCVTNIPQIYMTLETRHLHISLVH